MCTVNGYIGSACLICVIYFGLSDCNDEFKVKTDSGEAIIAKDGYMSMWSILLSYKLFEFFYIDM